MSNWKLQLMQPCRVITVSAQLFASSRYFRFPGCKRQHFAVHGLTPIAVVLFNLFRIGYCCALYVATVKSAETCQRYDVLFWGHSIYIPKFTTAKTNLAWTQFRPSKTLSHNPHLQYDSAYAWVADIFCEMTSAECRTSCCMAEENGLQRVNGSGWSVYEILGEIARAHTAKLRSASKNAYKRKFSGQQVSGFSLASQ